MQHENGNETQRSDPGALRRIRRPSFGGAVPPVVQAATAATLASAVHLLKFGKDGIWTIGRNQIVVETARNGRSTSRRASTA